MKTKNCDANIFESVDIQPSRMSLLFSKSMSAVILVALPSKTDI
jgi:hypothetical protein